MLTKRWQLLSVSVVWLFVSAWAFAAPQAGIVGTKPAAVAAQAVSPADPLGRTTPLGTVQGFINAIRQRDEQRAALYLNTRLRGAESAALARQLFVVINRRMPARLNHINDTPEGSLSDSLPLNQDLIGTIATANGKVDILVERVDRGSAGYIWLFSAETLGAVPDLYAEVSTAARPEQWLPQFLVRTRIASIPLFAWLAVILGMPLVYLLAAPPVKLVTRLAARFRPRFLRGVPRAPETVEKPIRLLIVAILLGWLATLGFSLRSRQFWADTAATVSIGASVWLLTAISGRVEQYLRSRLTSRNRTGMTSILRVGRRAVDALIVLAGLFVVLHHFGVNPTAALAGLGVGGIAVALAAQKTLENIIAGISLIMDEAVRVGDSLKVGTYEGTVDDVGLRSTRIRTTSRTVVSVPNGQMAMMNLETLSARDKYWFHPLIQLSCETTVEQIRSVVEDIRTLVAGHPAAERDSVRVRFLGFGTTSLDVEVSAYVFAKDWSEFLEIQEGLLFRTMEIVQQAGAKIALPSQITYFAPHAGGQPGTPSSVLPT